VQRTISDSVRRQLETTSISIDEVADICGFGSAEILRWAAFVSGENTNDKAGAAASELLCGGDARCSPTFLGITSALPTIPSGCKIEC